MDENNRSAMKRVPGGRNATGAAASAANSCHPSARESRYSSPARRTSMTTRSRSKDAGVSRRDMMRLGAGGLGVGLFGGIGPVPFVFSQASLAAAATPSGRILVVFEWFGGNDG